MIFVLFFLLYFSSGTFTSTIDLDGRIIGGTPANIIFFPYQVSLQNDEGHMCGGSVIHQNFILTAAHCLQGESINKLQIRAGSHFYNKGGVTRRICRAIVHENYIEDANYDYDIAILKLCKSLVFGNNIFPVALPEYDEYLQDRTSAVVSGWGQTETKSLVPRLQNISLVTHNQILCKQNYKYVGKITTRMLCAGCEKGKCDSCQGDSGGPLIARGKQVGIVSWGYGCADKDYPGVYTRVAKFRKWIKNKIRI